MRPLLRFSRALSLLWLLSGVAVASPALAQSATGALYGVVRDDRGMPLAKAKVTVRGEQGEARAQDTNAVGEFRFLTLEPGLYHAKVELPDYSTAEYPELPVHVGRSTSIDVILTPSSSGAVTVTAECPLLDERRIATGAYMTREELDKMPGARDPWALLEQAPGVLLDRVDVAGGDGVQPVVARAAGAAIDQNSYTLDGVIITDPQSLESTPFFYDFASLEEAQVTTGGTNVRVTTPGAAINLVTRRGTNAWRAAARYLRTDGDWQSDQDDLDLGAGQRFFTPSPRLGVVDEYGADAGGPILRDRLWMWGGFNRTTIDLDLDPASPILFDQGAGDRASDNATIKLDFAPKHSNRLQAFVYSNDSEIDRIGAGPTRSPEATLDLDAPTEIWKLEDSHVFGPTLYVQAHLSRVEGELELEPRGGGTVEPSVDASGVFRNGFLATTSTRDREQGRLEISGFFGAEGESHEMTVGLGRRRAEVTTHSQWGARSSIFLESASASGVVTSLFFQSGAPRITLDTNSIYVQDTLTTRNLIADIGIRYDNQEGERESELLPAHAVRPDLLPAFGLPGTGGELEWGSLAPRVGLTYGLGEKHATLLRASWSRFVDQMGTSMFDDAIAGPRLSSFPFAAVRFFDSDGDRQVDSTETQSAILGTMGGTVIDPSLDAPLTDEVLFGAEHAGVGCFSIGGRLTWRRYQDLLDTRPFVRDPAGEVRIRDDYRPDTIATGNLPDGGSYAVPVFALRPDLQLVGTQRLANGGREVEYYGATVWLERRLRNRWELRAYGNVRDETASVEPELFALDDPTDVLGLDDNDDAPFAPESVFADQRGVYLHSRWDYTVAGLYRARAGIGLAFLAHGREGYPLLYFENVLGSDGQTRSVAATNEGESPQRLDNVHLLDVRAEKELGLMGEHAAVTVSLDALNVLNRTPPLERETQLETATSDFVREILAPRVFRVGVRVEFR